MKRGKRSSSVGEFNHIPLTLHLSRFAETPATQPEPFDFADNAKQLHSFRVKIEEIVKNDLRRLELRKVANTG